MRLGDVSDLPFLPDSLYDAVYAEQDSNLNRAVVACGQMILAQLAFKTHRRMSVQAEVWGKEAFDSYKTFLLMTIKDPSFMNIAPLPYSGSGTDLHPLVQFQQDWNQNYYRGTQSQQLAVDASISPNDGSLYGPLGSAGAGWDIP